MADTNTTISTEQTDSLAAVPTPAPQAEEVAPLVLASNDVQVAAAAQSASSGTAKAADSAYNVVVKAPPAGGMLAYLVGPGAHIVLDGIDLNKATLAQEGGNLRITLANGAEVLLLDYVSSAQDSKTVVVTPEGTLPAQQLLAALEGTKIAGKDVTDVEPAAGPAGAGGEGGGLTPPTILGLGVGSGEGIFSSVIGPYAIPRPADSIATNEYPFEPGPNTAGPNNPGPLNNPPLARNDSFSTAVGKPITMTPGQLLANDSDPDGDALTIVSVQGATHGTVSIVNGNVVFTPTPGYQGTGSYSYTITDGHGGTSTADVIIQIDPDTPNNNEVIAADDAGTVVEGHAITINVLRNDSDPEGDALVPGSVRIVRQPSEGTVTVNADGSISFQSADNHSAAPRFVTFEYEVRDDKGAADTATVTIEITPSLNTVIAVDDTGEIVPAGATKSFNVTGNDVDPQADTFQITSIKQPAQGTATFDPATGQITYHSAPSNVGYDAVIEYTITDARGATDTATLTVRVEPVNNVSAVDDTADMLAGQDVRIDVLKNDFDTQGDAFHITRILQQPVVENGGLPGDGSPRGTAVINADGTITFTDTPGMRNSGVVELVYEIVDSKGAVDTAVVRITIGTAPNGVDANNDTFSVAQDAPRANVTSTLLANDFDPQNDTFKVTSITQPTVGQGTVELVGDQVFFTPAAGYHGPVVFSYTITDAHGAVDTAQVVIDVQQPANTDLNAGDDAFSTAFNTNLTITPAQVLSNDFDPEGTVLGSANIISFTQPLNGTVTRDASGNFIYNPNDTFRGTDSFTYTIRDAQGDEATATITIRVADPLPQDNPVNANDDLAVLAPGETRTINALFNDSAPDGGLQFVRLVDPLPAGVVNLGNGVFRYTADPFTTGQTVSFRYEVRDVDGDTDIATVTFKVEGPVIDRPVDAVNDAFTTNEDTPISFTTANLLANDSAPDGGLAFVQVIGALPAGLTFNSATGQFTYNPPANFNGDVSFQYQVRDVDGDLDTATVTIHVTPVDDPVDAVNDAFTTNEDTPISFTTANLLANDSAPDGGLTFVQTIGALPAGLTFNSATGQFTYNPPANFSGDVSFQYQVRDVDGDTDIATVTIHVVGVNDGIDAVNDAFTTGFNTNLTITPAQLLTNDRDLDTGTNAGLNIISFTQPAHGTVTLVNGNYVYNPNDTFSGTDTFTYTIRDAQGEIDTATVTIVVAEQPNTVVAVNDDVTMAKDADTILINAKANDFDPQGDTFAITRIVSVSAGTATIENGQIRYTNPDDAASTQTIVYEITDARGATSQATITVHIVADTVNTVVAVDDAVTMDRTASTILVNAKANDFDPDGDAFAITRIVNVSEGSATIENGQIRFNHPANAPAAGATYTVTYEVTDALGHTDTAVITITVPPAPFNNVVAVDDAVTMAKDADTILINAKANDYDPQGDTFNITRIVSVSNGTATIENGQIRYTYADNAASTQTIVYEITDSKGATSQATITVNVVADTVNSVVAVDDAVTMAKDADTILINAKANDFDPDGDTFAITRIVSVSNGTATIENGQIRYTYANDAASVQTIVYEITDALGNKDTATITVNIEADGTQPINTVIANDDTATMARDATTLLINAKANDLDPQGDTFAITRIVSVSEGTASIENGQIRFNHAANAPAAGTSYTVVYEVTDSKGATDTATITITVPKAPVVDNTVVAENDNVTMAKDLDTILINAKANDYDPQGDAFSITRIVSVSAGTATIENGQIRYNYVNNGASTQTIVYEVTDSKGAKDTATITVNVLADTVTPPNSVIARDDSAKTEIHTTYTGGMNKTVTGGTVNINVKANDSDPQGDKFDVTRIVDGPKWGSAKVNSNGTITYTASAAKNGDYDVTFKYEIKDSKGATDVATVTVHVKNTSTTVIGHDSDCPLTIDLNGDGISISMMSGSKATFDLDGNGTAEWTAWVNGSDDAILAIDRSGDGMIDGINEVFGGRGLDGFTELGRLEDSNADGKIDANDANWNQLKLWLDANSNGISEEGELHALADFGITSINLSTTDTSIQYGDAFINKQSTVTFADGHTTTSGSVFYTNDNDGKLDGTAGNDVLVYSSTADSIDGGQGFDTLKVLAAADIVVNHDATHSVESIDLANNGADKLTLNVDDILTMSDNGVLTVSGDAVDDITLLGSVTQGANVTQNGQTYASYVSENGGTVLVELGLTVHTQENQH